MKQLMNFQDKRVTMTTETLNSMKMLKLYSWTKSFEKAIDDKRNQELGVLWKRLNTGMINVTSLYFFPQILSAVIFSVFIGSGNKLDLSVAYTVMTILGLIKVRTDD
jgi:hypothetical protein